jgi:hypothetical protein
MQTLRLGSAFDAQQVLEHNRGQTQLLDPFLAQTAQIADNEDACIFQLRRFKRPKTRRTAYSPKHSSATTI